MDNRYWYFIGLWLGDGAKDATSITSADQEIIDFLIDFSKSLQINVSLYKSKSKAYEVNIGNTISYTRQVHKYSMDGQYLESYNSIKEAALANNIKYPSNIVACCSKKSSYCGGFKWEYGNVLKHNALRAILERYNLLNNKHIPVEFINESTEHKKYLLAGLIDSDGTLSNQTICIVQKLESIIDGVIEICHTLGYRCYKKVRYINNTPYYSIRIKGDLRDIPVLLERKKVTKVSKIPKNMNDYYN